MRKLQLKIAGISGVIAGLLGATSAHAVLFTLPEGAVGTTTAYIGDLFSDLGPFIFLAIGIPLAFFVIRKTISIVAGRGK